MSKYDVAAYVWPSYHPDPRARIFWPDGIGEWQTVLSNRPKFPGHTQPRMPLWGFCNENDRYVMQMQIDAAADHGVNVFIYDWYWYDNMPFLEGCLNDGFLKAKNNSRMKFYIMWANHNVDYLWDTRNSDSVKNVSLWSGQVDFHAFRPMARRIIEKYFSHPQYYKVNGKPAFMIFDLRNFIRGMGSIDDARKTLDWFREETVRAGFPGLEIQGVIGKIKPDRRQQIEGLGMDAITNYQIAAITNIDRDYADIIAGAKKYWYEASEAFEVTYYPHISVGWDNNPRFKEFIPGVVKNNTPEEFEKGLRAVKEFVDKHPAQAPLITVNSWNEWTETSYLQPCTMYGYGYLEAVKRVFGK